MPQLTINQALELAVNHHRAGRLKDAESLYRQVISVQPQQPDALHLLGLIAGQAGRFDQAADLIRRSLAAAPTNAVYLSDLSAALCHLGRVDEAIDVGQKAVSLSPMLAEAHCNLANSLVVKGDFDQGIIGYQRAIALKPELVEARIGLGNALIAKGELDLAIACLRRAVELNPAFFQAHCSLGNAFKAKGHLDNAVASFRRALEINPDYVDALNNLAVVFRDRGEPDQAIACCQRALGRMPNLVEAHCNIALALLDQGKYDLAGARFQQALSFNPGFAPAHAGLGTVFSHTNKLDQAIASYQQAIALAPHFADAHSNLGKLMLDTGQLDRAVAEYKTALRLKPDLAAAHEGLLYAMLFDPADDAAAILVESQSWNRRHAQPLAKFIQPHSNTRDPERPLRIGYVSSDFRRHSVAHFLLPLLSSHDRAKCHTVCYAQIAEPDEVTARFRSIAGAWRDTARMSDAAVADMIRNDAIDILIDLSGHSADNRLLVFAHKAAPVQMTFLGYPATTGMTAIDYRLTDALADPADEYCSEQLIRLPRTAWCFTPLDEAPAVTESPATQNGFVTFGSFNNLAKINQPLIHTWAEILRLVPNSRLLVRAKGLASASRQQWLRETFHQAGVEPDRLELSGSVPWADRLTAYGRIDIALDTYPYHGTTTTCDALWMGVPVVAQAGKSHLSRVGVSLLSSVGHPQWIADGSKQYFTIAAGLAADVRRLSELRSSLRSQFKASPLFDSAAYARDVEAAYRTMWRAWCDQPSP